MSAETKSPFLAFCGVLGAIALVAVVAKSVTPTTALPPLDGARGKERKSTRVEAEQSALESLSGYALLQKDKGIYRIPIDQAMEIVSEEWKSPSDGRAKLLERAEKAFKVEEPAAPALSEFE